MRDHNGLAPEPPPPPPALPPSPPPALPEAPVVAAPPTPPALPVPTYALGPAPVAPPGEGVAPAGAPASPPRRPRAALLALAIGAVAIVAVLGIVRPWAGSTPAVSAIPSEQAAAGSPSQTPSPTPSPTASPTPVPTAAPSATDAPQTAAPSPSSGIDEARQAALLIKLASNPRDTDVLVQLGDLYFAARQYDVAIDYYNKAIAINPKFVVALLARGAAAYNLGDDTGARRDWKAVVGLDPRNVEAHYDLGFLCMNLSTPDWACVEREWKKVIAIDPNAEIAKVVKQHLDSLAAASLLPTKTPKP